MAKKNTIVNEAPTKKVVVKKAKAQPHSPNEWKAKLIEELIAEEESQKIPPVQPTLSIIDKIKLFLNLKLKK